MCCVSILLRHRSLSRSPAQLNCGSKRCRMRKEQSFLYGDVVYIRPLQACVNACMLRYMQWFKCRAKVKTLSIAIHSVSVTDPPTHKNAWYNANANPLGVRMFWSLWYERSRTERDRPSCRHAQVTLETNTISQTVQYFPRCRAHQNL